MAAPYLRTESLRLLKQREADVRFLLDSGAFTAWKAGEIYQVEKYAAFVEALPFAPWRYFTLDVIGDPKGTRENLDFLLARGLRPVPIFTRGEDVAHLDDLYAVSDVVAVGGLVGTRGNRGFVNGMMRQLKGRSTHLLGFVASDFLKVYRPYSCDTSSWSAGIRYGVAVLYRGGGRFLRVTKKDFVGTPKREVVQAFTDMGFDHAIMRRPDAWVNSSQGRNPIEYVSFRSWVRFILEAERKIGSLIFLAVTDVSQARIALDQFDYCREHWSRK